MNDDPGRCPSRLTATSLDFTGPMTFHCTAYAGHSPETPHHWTLQWTDLGSDNFQEQAAKEMDAIAAAKEPTGQPEYNTPEYWAWLQDRIGTPHGPYGKDRP